MPDIQYLNYSIMISNPRNPLKSAKSAIRNPRFETRFNPSSVINRQLWDLPLQMLHVSEQERLPACL